MMRRLLVLGSCLAAMAGAAWAQVDIAKWITGNKASPEAIAAASFNHKPVWIFYHAPSVRGRTIFGAPDAKLKDDTVWRLGADGVAVLHTDAELNLGGLTIPKGEYALYMALDKGKWQLIVNKKVLDDKGQPLWGVTDENDTSTDNPATELGRAAMTMGKPASPVETLKIALADQGGGKGKLTVEWENVSASLPFTVR